MNENQIIDITDLVELLKPGSLATIKPSDDSLIQIVKKKKKFHVYFYYNYDEETSFINVNFVSKDWTETVDIVSKMLKLFPGYAIVRNFTEPDHVKIMKFEPFKEV